MACHRYTHTHVHACTHSTHIHTHGHTQSSDYTELLLLPWRLLSPGFLPLAEIYSVLSLNFFTDELTPTASLKLMIFPPGRFPSPSKATPLYRVAHTTFDFLSDHRQADENGSEGRAMVKALSQGSQSDQTCLSGGSWVFSVSFLFMN